METGIKDHIPLLYDNEAQVMHIDLDTPGTFLIKGTHSKSDAPGKLYVLKITRNGGLVLQ